MPARAVLDAPDKVICDYPYFETYMPWQARSNGKVPRVTGPPGPAPPASQDAPPLAAGTLDQATHTLDLKGSMYFITLDGLVPWPDGEMLVEAGGETVASAPVVAGRYRVHLELPDTQINLVTRGLGYEAQARSIQVSGDLSVELAPVCAAASYGFPGTILTLPARALLDRTDKVICDYPYVDTYLPWKPGGIGRGPRPGR